MQSGMLLVWGCPGHVVCAWHGVCGGWQCQGHWCGVFALGLLQSSGQHHLNSFLSQQYIQPAVQNHSHPALTRPCTEQAVIALESIRCPASTGTPAAREQGQGKWVLQGCASTEAVGAGAMCELLVLGYRMLGPWQDAASCPEVSGDYVSPIPPPSQRPPPQSCSHPARNIAKGLCHHGFTVQVLGGGRGAQHDYKGMRRKGRLGSCWFLLSLPALSPSQALTDGPSL